MTASTASAHLVDKPALVFVSGRGAFDGLALPAYRDITVRALGGCMNTLIASGAAMILIDGEHPDWRQFTTLPKVSPATRRIPILLVSDEAGQRAQALRLGADLTLDWSRLDQDIGRLAAEWGRIPDAQTLKALDCECAEALPSLAIEGLRQFNAGEYYRQHDLFEEQWALTEGPVRDLYRAILQVGIAYFQIARGNYRGAVKMLQRSVQWLTILPATCQGIDVEQLRRDSYAVRAELERLGAARLDEFDRALLKPLQWRPHSD